MPVYSQYELESTYGRPTLPFLAPREPEAATLWQEGAAAYRQEHSIVGAASYVARDILSGPVAPENPEYQSQLIRELIDSPFEPYLDRFVHVNSEEEAELVKNRIRGELRDRDILSRAGWRGFALSMLVQATDPINWFGWGAGFVAKSAVGASHAVGAAAIRRSALSTAKNTAITGTFSNVASEMALHATQETRTVAESAINVAGGAVIGAGLGGVAGVIRGASGVRAIPKTKGGKALFDPAFIRGVEDDFRIDDTDIGNQAYQTLNMLAEEQAEHFPEILSRFNEVTNQDTLLTGKPFFQKAAKFLSGTSLSWITPMSFRLVQSESPTVRRLTQELIESPFLSAQHFRDIESPISLETKKRMHAGLSSAVGLDAWESFKNYSKRIADVQKAETETAMNFKTFKEEVMMAIYRGDHEIPEVRKAAEMYRSKIIEPLGEEALESGALDALLKPDGEMFGPRRWSMEKVTVGRNQLHNIFQNHFYKENLKIYAERQSLFKERKKLNAEAKKLDKTKDSKRIKDIDSRLKGIKDKLKTLPKVMKKHLTSAHASKGADETITNILSSHGDSLYMDALPGSRVLGSRKINIRSELVKDFLDLDVTSIMDDYSSRMGTEIQMRKRFGKNLERLDEAYNDIREEYADLMRETDDPKKLNRLRKEMNENIKDLQASIEMLRGVFSRADPDSVFEKAGHILRAYNVSTMLGGMGLTSLPEMARNIQIDGFSAMYKTVLSNMVTAEGRAALKIAKQDIAPVLAAWETSFYASRGILADINGAQFAGSKLQRGMTGAANAMNKLSLNAYYDRIRISTAGLLNQRNTLINADKWTKGTISAADKAELLRFGINEDAAKRISNMWDQFGRIEDDIYVAGVDNWTDIEARDLYLESLSAQISFFTTTPTIGDAPRWFRTSWGKTFAQFETFNMAATTKILLAGLQRGEAKDLAMAGASMGVAMLVFGLKKMLRGQELPDDPREWIVGGLDQSGLFGVLGSVNQRIGTLTGNRLNASRLLGVFDERRVDPKRNLGDVLGPSYSKVADLAKVMNAMITMDPKASDVRAFRKTIPYQNVFYWGRLFDRMEGSLNDLFGNRPLGERRRAR